jgi:hypothetical protein
MVSDMQKIVLLSVAPAARRCCYQLLRVEYVANVDRPLATIKSLA